MATDFLYILFELTSFHQYKNRVTIFYSITIILFIVNKSLASYHLPFQYTRSPCRQTCTKYQNAIWLYSHR